MSIDKKKFKRLKLLCKAFQIEEEMFEDLDREYGVVFNKDFRKENEYLIVKSAQGKEDPDEGAMDPRLSPEKVREDQVEGAIKKLHRALARVTHPDTSGNEEEIKKIQEAYENLDVVTLLLEVVERDIDVDLTTPELAELEKNLETQKLNLKEKKNTLRWAWAESNKEPELRDLIRKNLGINPKRFREWIKSLKEQEGK